MESLRGGCLPLYAPRLLLHLQVSRATAAALPVQDTLPLESVDAGH